MLKAKYTDKKLVVDILCAAFDENKSVNYVVRRDNKRKNRIRLLMEYSFEICHWFGSVFLSEDKKACALALFPERKKTKFKTILLDIRLSLFCIGLTRISKIIARESIIKKHHPKNHFVYLWFIGVDPDYKRKGIGSALLKEIINEGNLNRRSIYLETSMVENLDFYKKMDFEIYKELEIGYKLFLIKRDYNESC